MKNLIKLTALVLLVTACDDVLSPATENIRGLDAMYKEPGYAQGILANAYILLPYSASPTTDVATDDAVSNNIDNAFLRMASGSWSANDDPTSQWQGRKNAIQYLNLFLANADQVAWSNDKTIRMLFNDRLKGEAYGLRALQMYHLLVAHGGWTQDGQLLGVPIVNEPETPTSNFNKPRNTFQECIDQILSDAEQALELLPLDYKKFSQSDIPERYKSIEGITATQYERVNGEHMRGRISGRIVEAIRAQAALLAASPAYRAGTNITWAAAANYAAQVLNRIGGVSGLASNGGTWYTKDSGIEQLASGQTPSEILWRSDVAQSLDLERDNYPPSLFGNGRVNPSQNLVDAFPMANGYPITHASSGYNLNSPYNNRDPRLAKYIVVNESQQGPGTDVIVTGTYGTNNDAINREKGFSTRTGYYLRKLLRSDVNPNPAFNTTQKHYTARIRYTEIFLAYAEAANEAWGPTGTGPNSYAAYDVIRAIRQRAGITGGDAYLESVKNDQEQMRQLIRNERRLELCFENHRFRDIRRWQVGISQLNETARGVEISKSGNTLNYAPVNVETRNYQPHMYHGPIPYGEINKWSLLQQNAGW
ncbi:RagB/SusD family nutrient uptake outer membrane protein [Fulvivirgaceae bacterium PWU4]|uniref:RagB/SusD family nutrient uptake outer membrane protein n=1 Tax=Chryseosolibacter histidini TaxID=2782349 RepID=A0AAP2DHX9_9BACT|nr:RagB/SusD family nutrient uptake outer membrane protein [Chryseosolibacter histidini]MBT1695537.1 RagB/SusD family nutrient uptake outer membrane protein [Chryseosolibacter histidini]